MTVARALHLIVALTLLNCSPLAAEALRVGQTLQPLEIDNKGELLIVDEEVEFKPWSSKGMENQVAYLQYMAARPSADKMNRHVNDALQAGGFAKGSFISTVIVNLDDVTFGASKWALKELKKNKLKHPDALIVADYEGKGRETWQLESGSSAVAVIARSGEVLFFKQGKLSEQERQTVLDLLRQQIAQSTQPDQ